MRLELTRRGDYAVRAMLALAARDLREITSGREIAAEMAIPGAFLPRVMTDMVTAGLARSTTGRTGGYALARPAADITLLQVIEAAEGDSRRTTCVLRGVPCGQDGHCQVHAVFFAAQDALLERFRGVTLAELAARTRTTARPVTASSAGPRGRSRSSR
ncbi:MAG TPA: Rrf2 family transcriptional regulator [Candidatus Limnocylindrales bacterium]|nr:Rrf2 family transcriptional regulator [Candidatus Limnocylindrales bacterium]